MYSNALMSKMLLIIDGTRSTLYFWTPRSGQSMIGRDFNQASIMDILDQGA